MCLNNLLKQSLGNVLCFGLYSNYIGSARNPADNPTRGVPLRRSDVEVPDWWKAAEGGDFSLSSLELHPYQLAGYDDLSDISGNPFLAVDPGLKHGFNRYCKKIRNKIRLRAKFEKDATFHEDCEASSNFFSEDVLTCLGSFGREQFIFQDGLSWPPQSQGFLDLYSGKKGFARSAVRYGASWVLTVDFLDGPRCDLLDNSVRKRIQFLLNSKVFIYLSAAPICSSFSRAINEGVRTRDEPWGIRNVSPAMKVKIADGNSHSKWLAHIIRICLRLGIRYWVENPDSSFLWILPAWRDLPHRASFRFYKCDYCIFKALWRKRIRFLTDGRLAGQRRLCTRDHKHVLLRGRGRGEKACRTKLAEPYPPILCSVLAHAACSDLGLFKGPVSLSCRADHRRIGEAKNPGPKAKLRRPIRTFSNLTTLNLSDKRLSLWAEDGILPSLWVVPSLMGSMMGAYGRHWYGFGGAQL